MTHFHTFVIKFNKLDLKVPISLKWIRFRPGIWDSEATSSTGSWTCERRSTRGCFGFLSLREGQKQCGIDIFTNIFYWDFGSNFLNVYGFPWPPRWPGRDPCWLYWSQRVKVEDGDDQYSVFNIAEVEDLQCSFTHPPRALEVSLT